MITLLLVAAAIAVLFMPKGSQSSIPAASDLFVIPPARPAVAPDSRAAIDSLLAVRDRLSATGSLSDQSAKAVDQLWLDLLHGSSPK